MREYLPRPERLCGKGAFNLIFKAGKRIKLPKLTIVFALNRVDYPRMGISIGRSFGRAAGRNRAKRLIREFFRRNKEIFPKGHDIVFIPREGWLDEDINGLAGTLKNVFKIKDKCGQLDSRNETASAHR